MNLTTTCHECKREFSITQNSTPMYCSSKCKQRAYRKRKKMEKKQREQTFSIDTELALQAQKKALPPGDRYIIESELRELFMGLTDEQRGAVLKIMERQRLALERVTPESVTDTREIKEETRQFVKVK